jgi:GT2 family glycosyltransferase
MLVVPFPRVRLVVLNYNGGDWVVRCVEHLEDLDWPPDRLEIVVVDNASADGSDLDLAARPRVRLIRSPRNLGFPANNLGLRDLDRVDYVGVINNDAFATPGYLRPLVDALDSDRRIGAACPKIVFAPRFVDLRVHSPTHRPPGDDRDVGVRISGVRVDGIEQWPSTLFGDGFFPAERGPTEEPEFRWTTGNALVRVPVGPERRGRSFELRVASDRELVVKFDGGADSREEVVRPVPTWIDVPLGREPYDVINNVGSDLVNGSWSGDRGFLEADVGQYDLAEDVFAWCGAGVLFRPDYLGDVGLFDERFFMYYEDTDMAWRGRARGWRYRYVPDAVLRHVHAATSVEGSPLFHHYVERNRLVMLTKNAPWWLAGSASARFLLSTASYARRDIVRPVLQRRRPQTGLVRARVRSFAAYLRMAPALLSDRRRLRRRQLVRDEDIVRWSVRR